MTDSATPTGSAQPAEPGPPAESSRHGAWGLYLLGSVVLGVVAFGVFSLRGSREQEEASETQARKSELAAGPKLFSARVTLTPPRRTVTLSGEVRPFRKATLYAKVSGYLKTVTVDKGDSVHAGQVLGVIEAPEMEKQIAAQQADLAIKQTDSARIAALAPSGTVSAQERDRAAADVTISQAQLEQLRAVRGYELMRAPFDGVITARYADPGALLQANGGALALVDVAQIDRVRIFIYLAQPDAVAVREGDPGEIFFDDATKAPVQATVTRTTKEIEERSRTMLTELDVDNPGQRFLPGTFVHVRLSLAAPQALAMPADALVQRNQQPMAAVLKDGRVHFTPIKIGTTDGLVVYVLDGLHEGDEVVLSPGIDVTEGSAVQATPKPKGPPG